MIGELFYIIGASGAGKDSLMNYARLKINGSIPLLFAHRYITRPHAEGGNENHIYLSPEEFDLRLKGQLFSLNWESHGQQYGIGTEIDGWLEKGYHVIVNGSRKYLPEARRRYSQLKAILVEASPEVIRERLQLRGRESSTDIQQRLERSKEISSDWQEGDLLIIQNDGLLEEAGEQLIRILSRPVRTSSILHDNEG